MASPNLLMLKCEAQPNLEARNPTIPPDMWTAI